MSKEGGSPDIDEQKVKELADQLEEHLFMQKDAEQLLEEGYEQMPEIVLDELKSRKQKWRDMIEAAEKSYSKRMEEEYKDVIKAQKELEKRSVVHCTNESFKKLVDKAEGEDKEHLIRIKEVWIPMLNAFFTGQSDDMDNRFGLRNVQKYETLSDEQREKLIAEGQNPGYEVPMFDKDGKPILEERLVMYNEDRASAKYYMLYLGEIMERILKYNVKEYKNRIRRK